MALTAEEKSALVGAIDTIVKTCGENPEYGKLVGDLDKVKTDLGDLKADAPARDTPDDKYSFEAAKKAHSDKMAAARNAQDGAGQDGGEGQ